MFAGAVALAAGRFQPLVRGGPLVIGHGGPQARRTLRRFNDVLTVEEAVPFASAIEARIASVVPNHDRLGDDCDFVTLAGDWPYRYAVDPAQGPAGGLCATDDLIGHVLESASTSGWLMRSRRRWAYTGRLLGGPAESVARAMSALFLPTTSALLWNTYGQHKPWSDYAMGTAKDIMVRALADPGAVAHGDRRRADLLAWHRAVNPVNRFGLMLVNSSGGSRNFTIEGGPGRPSDIPRGIPAAVAMIHSFSAATPRDVDTIAGRWLAQGAFVFFGAMNEPYLLAFRPPRLVAELIDAGAPLVAALRQGESEPFGFPWRLVYLGDPLFQPRRPASASGTSRPAARGQSPGAGRMSPSGWQALAPDYAHWPAAIVAARVAGNNSAAQQPPSNSDDVRLRWCLDAAIAELTRPAPPGSLARVGDGPEADAAGGGSRAWPIVLRDVRRDRLDRRLRPLFDDLLIDSLLEAGALDELQARLARISLDESGPRVWQAHETCATARFFRLAEASRSAAGFTQALDLWDEVIRLAWPKGAEFPGNFTERVAVLVAADPARRNGPWQERLARAAAELAVQPSRFPHAAVIAAEQKRFGSKMNPSGAGH